MAEELKMDLFAISLLGTTIQDGGIGERRAVVVLDACDIGVAKILKGQNRLRNKIVYEGYCRG